MMWNEISKQMMRLMINAFFIVSLMSFSAALTSCYHRDSPTPDGWIPTEEQMDSISFYTTHHYSQNYNFAVVADSLLLIMQQPTEAVSGMLVDTFSVYRDDPLVVADIVMLPADTVDSVWVQVARDEHTIGWTHESSLLQCVVPDNMISRFIDFFSDTHLIVTLAVVVVCAALFVGRRLYRRNAYIVHLRDIGSFYPALLAVLVAAAATAYSTIQLFDPESWRHFYYHPTVNPFSLPLHLGLFLAALWAVFIVGIAALYDIFRMLSTGQAVLYVLGLVAVCSVCYVVFSVSTLYYVGYPLLLLYAAYALWRYLRYSRMRYLCGNCGQKMRSKGICPYCGADNV